MPLSVGSKLGHYEVVSLLGQGGMGEVYRARDSKLDREVAIKVLPQILARDPERLARFQREAKVLASLDHPNIGHIHGIVDTEDSHGLVLALIEGPTLADRIDLGPIPQEEAIAIAKQIIEALEYAHDRGVVHRDLKPANVKITPEGVVKVLDFGLAKVLEEEPAASSIANSPTLTMGNTRAGMILGTASYMSPEQAVGRTVDRRSDIFSFGSVLYEMVTGKQAFAGPTTPDVLEAVVKNDPDWSALPKGMPAYLRRLLERCLTKDRKQRLQAIGEARIALENPVGQGHALPGQAASLPHKSGILWPILAAAGLAIAAGTFAWTFLRPTPTPEVTRFEIHAPPGTTLPLGTPAVSPDGRTFVFAAADKQQINHLYVHTLDSLDARLLPGTENAVHPFFSPDGRSIAFASSGRMLMRIDLNGGAPRALADVSGPWHGSWNQTGTILFQSVGINQISASGGPSTLLFNSGFPFFLPDGKRFLTYMTLGRAAGAGAEAKPRIELTTLGSKEHTLVLDDVGSAAIPAPVPGGALYLLYARGTNVMAQPFDLASGKLVGEPAALLDDVGRVANPAVMPTLGVSASGTLAFQKSSNQGEGSLTWYDRTGKPFGELASQAVGRGPVLSPDGQFAAVTRIDPSALTEDIWVVDLKRGTSSRLTFAKERDRSPIWSADGKRITFNRDGVGVFEKEASGAGAEVLLVADNKPIFTRSPDGKYLIRNELNGKAVLLPLSADAASQRNPVPVGSLNGSSQQFEFSPDGKYIAYSSNEAGSVQVYVQPVPPGMGRWQISVQGGAGPHWRRDGKELFFSNGDELMGVEMTLRGGASVSAGTPRALFRVKTPGGYAPAADGQRFLVYSDESNNADSPIIVVQNWWAALKK